MWTTFKVFVELLQQYFCFMILGFGLRDSGYVLSPGIEPVPPALEGEVLITQVA